MTTLRPLGVVHGLPIDHYHGGLNGTEYISKSGLDSFAKSPAIYQARHLDPNRPPRPDPTPAMVLGTMTHCAVLEPDAFARRHVAAPKVDRRTKAGKEDWQAFLSTLEPGQEAADPEQIAQAHAMAASIRRIAPLRDLLATGEPEVSAFYVDEPTGARCRVRPDWVWTSLEGSSAILLDVKTCMDASPEKFGKTVATWRYDIQAAMYCDGYEAATGVKVRGFVFAAVEKEYPYAAAPYMIDDDALERARNVYRAELRSYVACQARDEWPGYTPADQIQLLILPPWHNPQPKEALAA